MRNLRCWLVNLSLVMQVFKHTRKQKRKKRVSDFRWADVSIVLNTAMLKTNGLRWEMTSTYVTSLPPDCSLSDMFVAVSTSQLQLPKTNTQTNKQTNQTARSCSADLPLSWGILGETRTRTLLSDHTWETHALRRFLSCQVRARLVAWAQVTRMLVDAPPAAASRHWS